MEASAKQSKAGLDASIAISRTDQRAWISAFPVPMTSATINAGFNSSVRINNIGKTPALHILVKLMIAIVPMNQVVTFRYPANDLLALKSSANALYPNFPTNLVGTMREIGRDGKSREKALTADEVNSVTRDFSSTVAFYGRISYDDMFGFAHWIQFCAHSGRPTGDIGGSGETPATKSCSDYNDVDRNKDRR